jgi:lipid-A-disaccharide synthase
VLIVAGEPSGDRIAAGVARVLGKAGVRSFGMGGAASAQAGVELVADIRRSAAMGFTEVATRLPSILIAYARVTRLVRAARPRAAVLVNYTEYNLRLGRYMRRLGVPVLWCVAPQVWAWRRGRTTEIARALDRMAVILPFEEPLWRDEGVDAHYVGHPALDVACLDRMTARARLELPPAGTVVALLPGSRAHEVRRHVVPMLASLRALRQLGHDVGARLIAAASLDEATRHWLLGQARAAKVNVITADAERGAADWLAAFDAALVASGTATLEAALAGVPSVVVYRTSRLTAMLARRLLRTPHIALPNVVLGAKHYPELLQDDVTPRRIASEMHIVLERKAPFAALALELRRRLERPAHTAGTSSERIAALLSDWLGLGIDRDPRQATHFRPWAEGA